MTFRTLLLAATICLAPAGAQTDLLDWAAPNSAALIGVNLDAVRRSPLVLPMYQLHFQEMVGKIGFDPLRELDEILISMPAGEKRNNGLAIMRGSFDPEKLLAAVKAAGATSSTVNGLTVLTRQQPEGAMALTVLKNSLLLAGDPASVRTAIAHPLRAKANPDLLSKARRIRSRYDLWIASVIPASQMTASLPASPMSQKMPLEAMKGIEQFSGGLKMGPDLLLGVELLARSEKDAQSLSEVAHFLLMMMRNNKKDARSAAMNAVLEKAQLAVEGRTLTFSLTVPQEQLQAAMRDAMTKPNSEVTVQASPSDQGIKIYSSPTDMGVVTLPPPK